MENTNTPLISIVTTLYRSEKFIETFLDEVKQTMLQMEINNYELIIVVDGITDNAHSIAISRKEEFPKIKVVELSRNYGHHHALMAGLSLSSGKYVMIIDSDLEVRPSVIPDFYQCILSTNVDVVYGYQKYRKGRFLEKYLGKLFWIIFNLFSEVKVPEDVATERIMTRQYVDELVSMQDRNIFLAGMMYWIGFKQQGIPLKKDTREGESTYTLGKRLSLAVKAVTSFSAFPLKVLFNVGMIITTISFLLGSYFLIRKIFFPQFIFMGWTSLITAITFSTGIIVMSIGTIGIYLEKIFNQVKNRPLYIIKHIEE